MCTRTSPNRHVRQSACPSSPACGSAATADQSVTPNGRSTILIHDTLAAPPGTTQNANRSGLLVVGAAAVGAVVAGLGSQGSAAADPRDTTVYGSGTHSHRH